MKKINVIGALCVLLMLVAAADAFGQPVVKGATVTFTSNVDGTQVSINNRLVGKTPFNFKLPFGTYTMRATAAGYEDYVKTIRVGSDVTINIELQRLPVQFNVSVNSNPRGAAVSIDGRNAGNTPLRTRLLQGQHDVRVAMSGYDEWSQTVDVNGDVNLMADLHRRIRDFNLSVTANVRGAQVAVDDNDVGRAPYRGRIQEGQHTVRVTADGYEEYTRTIDVNGDVRLNADLRRMQRTFTLSIQANVDRAVVSINGQQQNGFAPMDLRLPEGRYAVKVTRRGYGSFDANVDLNRDQRIQAQLVAPKARLIIQTPAQRGPGGLRLTITLDGRRVNGSEFEVERGRHTVRVEAGGMVAERQIDCREGRVYTLQLVLDLQSPQESDRSDIDH